MLRWPVMVAVLVYQSLFLALGQIWANKLRATLTTIGIVIGVASVASVIAALTGLKTTILTEFENFGTNKVFIVPDRPERGPMRNAHWSRIRFAPELFDDLMTHCPSLSHFTRTVSLNDTVSFGDLRVENVNVAGIEPDWHEIENRSVSVGRPFSLVDNRESRAVCLINTSLQNKLGLDRDPSGQAILIGSRRFTVVGVLETRSESSMFRDGFSDSEVFVPFNTAYTLARSRFWFPFVMGIASARSADVAADAKAEALFYLRKARRIPPGEPDTFRVEIIEQYLQQFRQIATAITLAASGVVGISLLVGGVGIMNIMLVSVSERTREIGLRKAVGARPSAVLLQFLIEAVVLCCLGGVIGLAIGQGLTLLMQSIPAAKLTAAYIPPWAVLLSLGFAAGVGLIFGMFPALKAARLDPIEALRHE